MSERSYYTAVKAKINYIFNTQHFGIFELKIKKVINEDVKFNDKVEVRGLVLQIFSDCSYKNIQIYTRLTAANNTLQDNKKNNLVR